MGKKRPVNPFYVRALVAVTMASCASVALAGPTRPTDIRLPGDPVTLTIAAEKPHQIASVSSRYLLPEMPVPGIPDTAHPESNNRVVTALPPAPSSLALVFSALLAVGAYQGTRSLARLGTMNLPEWFHTGAPAQIGHVKVFDFGTSLDEPVFGIVLPDTRPLERIALDERPPPGIAFIPTRAPRSPPAAALSA